MLIHLFSYSCICLCACCWVPAVWKFFNFGEMQMSILIWKCVCMVHHFVGSSEHSCNWKGMHTSTFGEQHYSFHDLIPISTYSSEPLSFVLKKELPKKPCLWYALLWKGFQQSCQALEAMQEQWSQEKKFCWFQLDLDLIAIPLQMAWLI